MRNDYLHLMGTLYDMNYGATAYTFKKAEGLRKRMTKAERLLWEELRNKKFQSLKFRRQNPISRFIVDFYCHQLKLVVELDGEIHQRKNVRENDKIREGELVEFGLTVIRFGNEEVLNDTSEVLKKLSLFAL